MSTKKVAGVAVENSAFSFDKAFDYSYDENILLKPGSRVIVPFGNGNKLRQGIVMYTADNSEAKRIKKISSVIDDEPVLNEEMLEMISWIKERTFCTLFEAAKTILPAGLSHRIITSYNAVPNSDKSSMSEDERQILNFLQDLSGFTDGRKIISKLGFDENCDILEKMAVKGFLQRNYDSVRRMGDLTIKMVRLTESGEKVLESSEKLTKKQKEILHVLMDTGTASIKEICYFTGFTPAVIQALEKKGHVEIYDNEVYRNPYDSISDCSETEEIVLNDEQNTAYNNLISQYKSGKCGVSLLYGVTGSGKTMVYLKLIDSMLEIGKQVIVMVPEIALTPQTLNIFHKRYGKNIAVFHSALSVGQRTDEWKRVKRNEVKIVIGTRSAVFAPLENIGLIIIDEEQEHTYKSEQSPRYNAKDVAKFRCAKNNALLVLASATPSIETYANAINGRYTFNKLSKRYSKSVLPNVRIVDMCTDALSDSSYFSKILFDGLKDNLDSGRQSILLINRRGYNTFASCRSCGHVITCPSCSISMTYHHANGRLMCHYCGYSEPFTNKCPECGSVDVRYSGFGTQKIEDELSSLLPQARVLRMDADSTMGKFSHEKKLNLFASHKYDILLGTQMVAKGLDFENVTLVGVINADQQLNNDDFRSQERTFDLLTQVVGRSGRGKYTGTAVIQTMNPENEVIRIAAAQDYETFYKEEISMRKMLIYPPYCDICLIGFIGTNETKVQSASKKFFEMMKTSIIEKYSEQKIIALGPMAARVSKISNKYRYRLILKCKNSKLFRKMIRELLIDFSKISVFSDVTAYVDINPENII